MRTLLLFDGLGGSNDTVVAALRTLYARPENHAYFERVFAVVDEVLTYIGTEARNALLPAGLAMKRWLEPSADSPPGPLDNSIVAGVCVHAYQVCHLQPTGNSADGAVAALGHSIGLQAAVVAGMRLRRMDEFLALAASSLKLVAVSLVRAQQLAAGNGADPDLVRRYLALGRRNRPPSPMASLSGMSRHELHGAVHRYNQDGGRTLSLGLVNSPTTQVLSGSTEDLLGFYFANESRFVQSQASWAFLPGTIPFHSAQLAPAAQRVREDLGFIGPLPRADQLELPVYATDGPRNLQRATDLVDEFLNQVLVRPIEWELAAGHAVSDARVERVVDCGPGPGARRFTRECLGAGAQAVRFESVHQSPRRAR
ncbi:hypothetical protein GCM10010174_73360 [Kutzneria viridogrisea]|uniref:Malonyl-CoA:ACP transacylase (MAT) domain-containing protein n=2 Tax=Kutzneria TaxID=43356 RepID=W5WGU7_9PSEU|nr:hypothetical protein KALB_4025 [Kutzneria albida DSM 43870]